MSNRSYDPGEHRVKHCWGESQAGFSRQGDILIGKCPATLTRGMAQQLLDEALSDPPETPNPKRLYTVHQGVVYEAVESNGAWHGYPWRYRPGRRALSRQMLARLQARAQAEGDLKAFQRWIKEHGR